MTNKEKIRKEVERLRNLHQMKYHQLDLDADSSLSLVECGKRNLCNELLSFIDSLQEEPVSEDLEEVAEQYAKDYLFTPAPTRSLTDHFKAGAKWQKQQATNNNIWHSIDEKADGNKFVVLYDVEGGYMSPPSRSAFGFDSDFINAMNKKYGANYTMWAYKDDLTPKKED